MTEDVTTDIADFDLPYKRRANLKDVTFASGMKMLRLTLRENRRFTIIDLDAETAQDLGAALTEWAQKNSKDS